MTGRIEPARDESASELDDLSISGLGRINALCDQFEEAWRSGLRPRIEAFLPDQPASLRTSLLREFLLMELELRESEGDLAALDEYLARFPEHAAVVRTVFERSGALPSTAAGSTVDLGARPTG